MVSVLEILALVLEEKKRLFVNLYNTALFGYSVTFMIS